jgi:adenylate kinase
MIQREDDRTEAVRVRMDAYEHSPAPLTDYYRKRGPLISVSAEGTPEAIYQRSLQSLEARSA